jgi:hypothetical protein
MTTKQVKDLMELRQCTDRDSLVKESLELLEKIFHCFVFYVETDRRAYFRIIPGFREFKSVLEERLCQPPIMAALPNEPFLNFYYSNTDRFFVPKKYAEVNDDHKVREFLLSELYYHLGRARYLSTFPVEHVTDLMSGFAFLRPKKDGDFSRQEMTDQSIIQVSFCQTLLDLRQEKTVPHEVVAVLERVSKLPRRQKETIRYAGELRLENPAIAEKMGVGKQTVMNQMNVGLSAIGVADRKGLVELVRRYPVHFRRAFFSP